MGDDSWVGQLYIVIFTIWELGINRTIYVAVESARQLCYSNEPSMVLIMGGRVGVRSVFVRAYVSMQDVWPHPLVALTLPMGSGLGQRGPCALDHDKLMLPAVACWVPWAGMG